jgi:hypothetical protein
MSDQHGATPAQPHTGIPAWVLVAGGAAAAVVVVLLVLSSLSVQLHLSPGSTSIPPVPAARAAEPPPLTARAREMLYGRMALGAGPDYVRDALGAPDRVQSFSTTGEELWYYHVRLRGVPATFQLVFRGGMVDEVNRY